MLSQTYYPAPGLNVDTKAFEASDLASARYRRWVTLRQHLVAAREAARRRSSRQRPPSPEGWRWIRAAQPTSGTLSRLP